MKFLKYLIFTIFAFLSVNAYSKTVLQEYPNKGSFDSEASACQALASSSGPTYTYQIESSSPYNRCRVFNSAGTYQLGAWLVTTKDECKAGQTAFLDGYITPPDAFAPDSVCYKGCIWNSDGGGTAFDTPNGNLSWGINAKNTGKSCTVDTPKGEDKPVVKDGCKSGEAYCDKPTTGCPSGYTSGSFNGKQICVKNNPDPTKPNPNDPNNNPNNGGGKFDDSKIIAAINDSKTAITNSINNAVNSINSSISSINQSITTVANAVNGTTNAVNNNTAATNAVKSSVDALHNTINAVTTAVNNNTTAVTSAVNANTSATNAVKASVDALNSTVSAVTTAVDNNTKAVNANGDKVSNAVKDNITATNAVKDAVSNLNSSINAVADSVNSNGDKVSNSVNANGKNTVDAINSNGKNTVDAVNAGTEATKENGKKLDGVKSSVDEGNSLLKDIKDWLTKEPELETGELEIKEEMLPGYERKDYVQFTNSCPFTSQQESLPMGVLGTITFTKDLTFICSYGADARPYIIGLGYLGALIYLLYGLRSRNG